MVEQTSPPELEAPSISSFSHQGKTYNLHPKALTGEGLDLINAAHERVRVAKVFEQIKVAEALPEDGDTAKAAKMVMVQSLMESLSNSKPLTIAELSAAVKDMPEVGAALLNYCSPECGSLEEAEKVCREHPYHELGLRLMVASGVREVGKSKVLRALLIEANRPASGDSEASGESS